MSPETLTWIKDVSIVLAGIVALITLVSTAVEARRRNRQHRAETFVLMRRRFLESPEFQQILMLLHDDSPELAALPVQVRRNFAGFMEEVALMTNSKLLSPVVASYMFGRYVVLTERSRHFWEGMDKDERYWSLFRSFASQITEAEGMRDPYRRPPSF